MTRGIFIAGNESALLHAVSAEAAGRVERYAAAIIPSPFSAPPGGDAEKTGRDKSRLLLPWNPVSALSARTLVMAAESRLGRIDDAVLVCSPPALYRPAEALNPAEIDKYINEEIKSWFFLARELVLFFRAQPGGTLALAAPDIQGAAERDASGKDIPADLPFLSAAASFRALADGLLASSGGAFRIMGFSGCDAGGEADFSAWLFKTIEENKPKNSGRWHKYSKLPFFK